MAIAMAMAVYRRIRYIALGTARRAGEWAEACGREKLREAFSMAKAFTQPVYLACLSFPGKVNDVLLAIFANSVEIMAYGNIVYVHAHLLLMHAQYWREARYGSLWL